MELTNRTRPTWLDSSIYPFRDNWMIVEGHFIHYVDEGPRDKPVLLFVHPGPGWSFAYRYHIRELSRDFRCVAPDFPGYGLSQAAKGYSFTLTEQAEVLTKFVEALHLDNIIVWANDAGGPTSILGLAPLIDRVDGLVVGGTFGWSLKPYRTVSLTLRIATSSIFRFINRYTNILAWSMGHMAVGTRKMSRSESDHYQRPFKDRDSRNRPLRLFRSFLDRETQHELDNALQSFRDKPALVQFGDKDPMTGQHWPERWTKEIPRSRVYIIPRVKHFTFEDAPEATVENFREWWKTIQVTTQHQVV
jgi:haloalkane dehalogenase